MLAKERKHNPAERQGVYYRGAVITGGGDNLRVIRDAVVRILLDAVIVEFDKAHKSTKIQA